MMKWLASQGLTLLTLMSMCFWAGISYSQISNTAEKVKVMELTLVTHTIALTEIVTELKLSREEKARN